MSLVIRQIRKQFKQQLVLKDITLQVAPGEIHAIVGVSGSGKSTLLRMIAGLETVHEGDILWSGRSLTTLPAHKRRVTMLSQAALLFPHLTVGENVTLATPDRSRQDAAYWLEQVQLNNRFSNEIHELSGGEQQRVNLARALAAKPELLLLDEPFTNLDPVLRYDLQRFVRDLVKRLGLTAVLVTHDREEAMLMADRVTLLEQGVITATDTSEALYRTAPGFGEFVEFEGALVSTSRLRIATDDSAQGERVTLVRRLSRFGQSFGEFKRQDGSYLILALGEEITSDASYQLIWKEE